jgi:hypothetical protein
MGAVAAEQSLGLLDDAAQDDVRFAQRDPCGDVAERSPYGTTRRMPAK